MEGSVPETGQGTAITSSQSCCLSEKFERLSALVENLSFLEVSLNIIVVALYLAGKYTVASVSCTGTAPALKLSSFLEVNPRCLLFMC